VVFFIFSFFLSQKSSSRKERGFWSSSIIRRDEEKGPKGQKGKKKGEGVKERHNKRTVVTKKREKKRINSDL
jgi:hypothetical protein